MNRYLLFVVLSIIGLSGSCVKDPVILPDPKPPVYKSILDIKWHRYFYSDTTVAYMFDPYMNDQYVGFCSEMLVTNTSNQTGVGIFDKLTGKLHPAWNGNPGINLVSTSEPADWLMGGINNEFVVVNNYHQIDCYKISNGEHIWSKPIPHLGANNRSFKNLLFVSSDDAHTYGSLFVYDIPSGSIIDTITFYTTNDYQPSIEPPGVWINPDGDTVLILQNRQWNFPASDGKVDIYAYNMRSDSIIWKIEDISNDGNSSVYPPIIGENMAFFQGAWSVHGIDLIAGKVVWEYENVEFGLGDVEDLLADGKLFVHSSGNEILAFNASNGNLLWKTGKDYGINVGGRMDYYKGKLYFNSIDMTDVKFPNYLFCINATYGSLEWKGSGVLNGAMYWGVRIDQSTGYLYCTDASSIMCIDLNTTPLPKK